MVNWEIGGRREREEMCSLTLTVEVPGAYWGS